MALVIETQTVAFASQSAVTGTFASAYTQAPNVVAISTANHKVFVSSVTNSQFVVETSIPYTGNILVQILK